MKHPDSLINRTRVKRLILGIANEHFAKNIDVPEDPKWNMKRAYATMSRKKFTQVSDELLTEINRTVRKMVEERVTSNRHTGKTVK